MDLTQTLPSPTDRLFPDLDLGDDRRDQLFDVTVHAILQRPGLSLPQLFPNPSRYNSVLNLFRVPCCSHEAILSAHACAVLNDLESRTEPVLFLHDDTHLDYSGHTTLKDDLGPIGNGGGRGWIAHQTIAVNPNLRLVHGLVSQILYVREESTKGENVAKRRERKSRESRLWEQGLDAIGPTPAQCHWVHVADRGADIFEFLQTLRDRRLRFLIRSTHNRALGIQATEAKAKTLLHDRLKSLEPQVFWQLALPARTGVASRTAQLAGVAEKVSLRPPHVRKGCYRREPIEVWAIRVWEPNPPAEVEPLEWFLLTSEPVDKPDDVMRLATWYSRRWMIEDYHKVQKSGVGVEKPQVQTTQALAALVAMLSVIAVSMMNLRLAAQTPELQDRPAEQFVPPSWVAVLRQIQVGKNNKPTWTVADFFVELARRGGYMKNPKKHPPGWTTLWRGWSYLQIALHARESIPKIP